MLRALLIDDEQNNLENLAFMLQNYCKGIEIAGMVSSAAEAREWLNQGNANVLFLDIAMPIENGFELLKSIDYDQYKIVFVTAFNQYALQAIKANALDYLLKPINIDELNDTVEKLKKVIENPNLSNDQKNSLNHFLQTFGKKEQSRKIALPQIGGMSFVDVDDIVSLQADSNYTIIHLSNMQKMVISKTLKDFEELLDQNQFARIHKSYIIHLKYIKEYSSSDGGLVKMSDGNQWSVSRRQLDLFIDKMKTFSLMFKK
jgi:two-component system LytT family response regulator